MSIGQLHILKTSISFIFICSSLLFKSSVKIDLPFPKICLYFAGKFEYDCAFEKFS